MKIIHSYPSPPNWLSPGTGSDVDDNDDEDEILNCDLRNAKSMHVY